MKIEYKVVAVRFNEEDKLERQLNELALEGFKVIHFTSLNVGTTTTRHTAIMARESELTFEDLP